ncbi:hypothetical protein KW782_03385 [Candidatus Parcubacteria bacterium]|nr:hypothetical protein [Candidatus Parcubacteria bacterium]
MGIKLHEVTWYSKLAAILFFIVALPAFTFFLGREYERSIQLISDSESLNEHAVDVQNSATTTKRAH